MRVLAGPAQALQICPGTQVGEKEPVFQWMEDVALSGDRCA